MASTLELLNAANLQYLLANALRTAQSSSPGLTVTQATLNPLASATYTGGDAAIGSVYELEAWGNGVWGSTAQALELAVVLGGNTMSNITLGANFMATSAAFRWRATVRVVCLSPGTGGTWQSTVFGECSVYGTSLLTSGGSAVNATNSFISCESSGSTTLDTTVNQTLSLSAAWGSTTGAPTLTSRHALFRQAA